ncbi:MAG: TolC family protein, partial [Victivallales bacterium]|nr:TolC family protein [Victivallales bacterium]
NKQLYGDTKLKYEAGAVPLTDLLNFEMKVHDAESAVLTQEYNFFTSRSILAELMGLTNAILPEKIFPKLTIDEEQFSIDVNTYLDTALLNRPDLKAYREALLSSKYKVAARWGAFMPTLNASASWGHQRNDWDTSGRWHFRNQAQNQSFDYGFDAEWVLFNGGKRIFDLREAQANLAVSKQKLAEHWISVVAEVRQTYADLTQKFKQTVIFKQNLTLNKQTRELINEAYKAGNASITRLNEVQRNLVVAETNLSTAVIDLENAKAKLNAAIGSIN